MPLFKATWLTRYKQAGASFSLYRNGADYDQTMTEALKLYLNGFGPLMGEGVELGAIRVSDEAIPKDSLISEYNITTTEHILVGKGKATQIKPLDPSQPNDNNSCLLLSLVTSPQKKGRLYMRFYPDGVALGSRFVSTPAYNTGTDKLQEAMRDGGWSFMAVPTGPGVPIKNIALNGAAPNIVVITAPGHGCVAEQNCRVSRVKGSSNAINNIWKVFAVNGNDVTLQASNGLAGFVWEGNGFIKSLVKSASTISGVHFKVRISERKSGRPFGVQVGRRRVRRK